jgi:hypothetical protein
MTIHLFPGSLVQATGEAFTPQKRTPGTCLCVTRIRKTATLVFMGGSELVNI